MWLSYYDIFVKNTRNQLVKNMNLKITLKHLLAFVLLLPAIAFAQVTFTDSNLPIVIINTDINPDTGQPTEIPDEPKVWADMKIIFHPDGTRNYMTDVDNADFLDYNARIKIELRGSTSQSLPKKQYGWTTYDTDGNKQNVSILGMPSENDWILNGLAFDATLMRDYLVYNLSRQMGQYASRTQYCEVVINGDYRGLYVLQEKLKDDSKRINVEDISEDDISGVNLTGGYITKADKTTGGDPVAWVMQSDAQNTDFIHTLPKPEDVTVEQDTYIHSQFTALETAANNSDSDLITGYPSVIDVPTFVDFMILNELSSNVDAYQISTYFHKDRGGKLRAGPVWDFNLSFGHDEFGDRSHTDIWQFDNGDNEGPRFWKQLFANTEFKCYLSKRWNSLTTTGNVLNYDNLSDYIDETVELISEAAAREQQRWGTVPNHAAEITALKAFIAERIDWMTDHVGTFTACNEPDLPQLVINRINYHPGESDEFPESDDQEFIEIKNAGNETVNLTGMYLRELGISYQFPANATLEAGQGVFIASNPEVFEARYGFAPYGKFERNLSNSTQRLVLADGFGNVIDDVEYDDDSPWPDADGNGSYLLLTDTSLDNSLASSWTAVEESSLSVPDYVMASELVLYPNPVNNMLNIQAGENIDAVAVYDVYGKQIKTLNTNDINVEVDFSQYQSGIYIVTITTAHGVTSKKVIKR